VVMVLPSEAALDALKQEVFEVEGSDVIPEDGPLPPGSPPRASFMTQSKARPVGGDRVANKYWREAAQGCKAEPPRSPLHPKL